MNGGGVSYSAPSLFTNYGPVINDVVMNCGKLINDHVHETSCSDIFKGNTHFFYWIDISFLYFISHVYDLVFHVIAKGGFKSEDTGEFFRCQHKYSKSLS